MSSIHARPSARRGSLPRAFAALRLAALMIGVTAASLFSHARWTDPQPRKDENIKVEPCGGKAPGAPVDTFRVGTTEIVKWDEFIDHPGFFTIGISYKGDSAFKVLATVKDSLDKGKYSYSLKVPVDTCKRCTIRLLQHMVENKDTSLYYSCADVAILPKPASSALRPFAAGSKQKRPLVLEGLKSGNRKGRKEAYHRVDGGAARRPSAGIFLKRPGKSEAPRDIAPAE